jgi:hypothetical protein
MGTLELEDDAARQELQDIKALGLQGRQMVAAALGRLAAFIRDAKWRRLGGPGGYASVQAFLTAEFPVLADLSIPAEQRRELVGALTGGGMAQKAIASSLGVSQQTVSRDRGITNVGNSEGETAGQAYNFHGSKPGKPGPGKRGRGRPPKAGKRPAETAGHPPGDRSLPDNGERPQEASGPPQAASTPSQDPGPGSAAPEMPAIPAALPEEELERLREEAREETRRAVAHELKAKFEGLWNDLARECEARQAQVEALLARNGELEAEVERLSGRMKRCPVHGVPLVPSCPACSEEAA